MSFASRNHRRPADRDPLLDAIRQRLRPLTAPESLRARIEAMLAAERAAERGRGTDPAHPTL